MHYHVQICQKYKIKMYNLINAASMCLHVDMTACFLAVLCTDVLKVNKMLVLHSPIAILHTKINMRTLENARHRSKCRRCRA